MIDGFTSAQGNEGRICSMDVTYNNEMRDGMPYETGIRVGIRANTCF